MGNRNQVSSTSSIESFLPARQEPLANQPPSLVPSYQSQVIESEISDQMTPTATIRPSIHITRESVQINSSGCLSFKFISKDPAIVSFYYFAIESLKAFGNTECYYIDTDRYPSPVQFDLPGVQGDFSDFHQVSLDFSRYPLEELTFSDNKTFPLIIEFRCKQDEETIERTYCKFVLDESLVLKAFKQKLTIQGRSFELKDIYGFRRDIVQDCVVCLTDPVTTVVLPCRHFCLCLTCSNVVRGQNTSKCPICRIPVESLLHIRMNTN